MCILNFCQTFGYKSRDNIRKSAQTIDKQIIKMTIKNKKNNKNMEGDIRVAGTAKAARVNFLMRILANIEYVQEPLPSVRC